MSPSPRELILSVLDRIGTGRFTALADCYADDVVIEHPQQHPEPGWSQGLGPQREHWAYAERARLCLVPKDVTVHETPDPQLIVAEFRYEGEVATTGRRFRYPHISILRARAGRIVHARDCQDDLALAIARERVHRLVAAMERTGARSAAHPAPTGGTERGPYGAATRELVTLLVTGRFDELEPLFAQDAVVTPMFLPGNSPARGWAGIRAALAACLVGEITHLVIHEGTDGRTVIADVGYQGAAGQGIPFRLSDMLVVSWSAGQVTEVRAYRDSLRTAVVQGRLSDVAAAGAGTEPPARSG